MNTVAIVQARTTSTRLPGKVLMDLAGRPMIAQQLARLKLCREIDDIIVATTTNATDDPLVKLAEEEGVRWYRGSEADVLSRYIEAAREVKADVIVRSTADCPLTMPEVIDEVVRRLVSAEHELDYVSNVVERTYPQGLDIEAMFRDTLERVGRLGTSAPAREHVTYFILRERPDLFLLGNVFDAADNSALRWTVDTAADLELARWLYTGLGINERVVPYSEVLAFARTPPQAVT